MTKINYVGKCVLVEQENKEGKHRKKILAIGDLHLGYGENMRMSGIMIPDRSYEDVVKDIDRIMNYIGRVDEVILLGDIKHEFGRILDSEWREIKNFIDHLKEKCNKIIIVKGNHDKITEIVTKERGLNIVDDYILNDIAFVHGDRDFPEIYDKNIKYWIMGHGHPAIRISDNVKEEKYKCFLTGKYKGKEIIILPSFFSMNEGTDVRDFDLGMAWPFDLMRFNVKVVGENLEVLDFGTLRKIK